MSKKNSILLLVFVLLVGIYWYSATSEKERVEKDIKSETVRLLGNVEKSDIKEIYVKDLSKGAEVSLKLKNGVWVVANKNDYPADDFYVNRLINAVARLRRGHLVDTYAPEKDKVYGFDNGVLVKVKGITFKLGQSKEGGNVFIEMNNKIYAAPGALLSSFKKYDNDWRSKKLFPGIKEEDVKSITVDLGKARWTVDNAGFIASINVMDIVDDIGKVKTENTYGDKKKQPIPKGSITITFKDGSTKVIEVLGEKIKDKGSFLVKKDNVVLGVSKYYFDKLLKKPEPGKKSGKAKSSQSKNSK